MKAALALLLPLATLGLTGCVSFLPDQRQDIVKQLGTVGDEIAKIRATVEADAPVPTPYAKVEPNYVTALASLGQAKKLAESRASYSRGRLSGLPATNSAKAITNCRDAIERDRLQYKTNGPAPNQDDNLDILEDNCSIARFIESVFRK